MSISIRARLLFVSLFIPACSDEGGMTPAADARVDVSDAGASDTRVPEPEPDVPDDAGYDVAPPPTIDPRTCSEIDLELNQAFSDAWRDPNACSSDADCTLRPLGFRCPNPENDAQNFSSCSLAIHVDSSDEVDALVKTVEEERCPEITGCFASADCAYDRAACREGACVPVR